MTDSDRRRFLQQVAGSAVALALTPSLLPAAPRRRPGAALQVAVIGMGRQGTALVAELAKFEAAELVAVCDTSESRLRRAQRRAPGAKPHASLGELLAAQPAVQAVFVATPTFTHRDVALEALAAGKHVYCEGPLAVTIEHARDLVRAARKASQVFQVGHIMRSNPVYQLARAFLRSGNIRDLVQLRAHSHEKNSWRSEASSPEEDRERNWKLFRGLSGGLIGELGTHSIDTVAWFTGAYPVSVRGSGSRMAHDDGREHADTLQCQLTYEGGLRMAYDATLCNSFEGTQEVFLGTMGTIRMAETFGWMFKEADATTQGWEVYASREKFHNEEGITLIADATKLAKQGKLQEGIGLPNPPLYYAVQDFLKSVLEGHEVSCTVEDGFRAAAVGSRCLAAIDSGEPRLIEEDLIKVSGS